ncbi:MAG: quinol:cytochrome C oxidoreductase, partial [Myxococcota bacterium]
HDLGKLLFGFMCFWTYVSFSQWMLIWYAGIPEEATWFHKRWEGGWHVWSVALVLGHFVFPFFFLISRIVKRNFALMMFGAAWLIGMHVADIYWYVLPQAGELRFSIGDAGALLFTGGVFFAYVLHTLTRVPLIPIGDPRLGRCLNHHQSH